MKKNISENYFYIFIVKHKMNRDAKHKYLRRIIFLIFEPLLLMLLFTIAKLWTEKACQQHMDRETKGGTYRE